MDPTVHCGSTSRPPLSGLLFPRGLHLGILDLAHQNDVRDKSITVFYQCGLNEPLKSQLLLLNYATVMSLEGEQALLLSRSGNSAEPVTNPWPHHTHTLFFSYGNYRSVIPSNVADPPLMWVKPHSVSALKPSVVRAHKSGDLLSGNPGGPKVGGPVITISVVPMIPNPVVLNVLPLMATTILSFFGPHRLSILLLRQHLLLCSLSWPGGLSLNYLWFQSNIRLIVSRPTSTAQAWPTMSPLRPPQLHQPPEFYF